MALVPGVPLGLSTLHDTSPSRVTGRRWFTIEMERGRGLPVACCNAACCMCNAACCMCNAACCMLSLVVALCAARWRVDQLGRPGEPHLGYERGASNRVPLEYPHSQLYSPVPEILPGVKYVVDQTKHCAQPAVLLRNPQARRCAASQMLTPPARPPVLHGTEAF